MRFIAGNLDENTCLPNKSKTDASLIGDVFESRFNIPLVGFHDFLCVLLSGNRILCKLSSEDKLLLPALAKILIHLDSDFEDLILFSEGNISNFDAVIATGSTNSLDHFVQYFSKCH